MPVVRMVSILTPDDFVEDVTQRLEYLTVDQTVEGSNPFILPKSNNNVKAEPAFALSQRQHNRCLFIMYYIVKKPVKFDRFYMIRRQRLDILCRSADGD